MNLFQKADFFFGLWWTGKNGCLSHTHTGSNGVLTAFESFRSENLKKTKQIRNQHALRILSVFSKLKSKASRRSYSEKRGMPPLSLCLNESGGTCSGGRTHTRTRESSSFFTQVGFEGMSHMTYCRQTRDKKKCCESLGYNQKQHMCGNKFKKNLLLQIEALGARMQTSLNTSPIPSINWLVRTSPLVRTSTPLVPLNSHM